MQGFDVADLLITSQTQDSNNTEYRCWSHGDSVMLINLYKKYKNRVGTMQIRNFRKMWEIIAKDISSHLNKHFSPSNCENRWRVLERNYKKVVDNNNKTGRGRKTFEFMNEMNEIFKNKKNIYPVTLLSSDTPVQGLPSTSATPTISAVISQQAPTEEQPPRAEQPPIGEQLATTLPIAVGNTTLKKNITGTVQKKRKLKCDILEQIRKDKLKYQENILEHSKETTRRKLDIQERRLEEKKRRNNLIEERNQILKEYLNHQLHLPPDI